MTIQYCSDLHLEFRENHQYITRNPIEPAGEILILAGDIIPFALVKRQNDFFNYISDHFANTYWIPGNHEYYDFDISERSGTVHEKIRENVFLINNTTVMRDSTRLIFSTLWSKIGIANAHRIENSVSDFSMIQMKGGRFTADDFNKQHSDCLQFIETELAKEWTGKTVVTTHHVPTFKRYPPRHKNSIINEAFATELSPMIESKGPDYWIYGHHHYNIPAFKMGSTILLTNQLGYVHHHEHGSFDSEKCVEV